MAVQKGNIGITTENIFPVIKKFLYSDHEIFLREIVSNAVDATQKLRTLSAKGEFKGSLDDLKVSVKIDKEAGTLTVRRYHLRGVSSPPRPDQPNRRRAA